MAFAFYTIDIGQSQFLGSCTKDVPTKFSAFITSSVNYFCSTEEYCYVVFLDLVDLFEDSGNVLTPARDSRKHTELLYKVKALNFKIHCQVLILCLIPRHMLRQNRTFGNIR